MQGSILDERLYREIFLVPLLLAIISFTALSPVRGVTAENSFDRNFEWDYKELRWTWSLSIPQSLYESYKSVSVSYRIKNSLTGYSFLVTTQDDYVIQVANKLHEVAVQEGFGAYDEVSFVLAFVQSLPYTSDSVTAGYDEYPRFPIETLVDYGGDCEDTSILFATLVLILDYDAIFTSPPNHSAVGVWGTNLHGYYWTYNGRTYYYCETTGNNFRIGDIPNAYKDSTAHLYAIDENKQYLLGQNLSRAPYSLFVPILAVSLGVMIMICAFYTFGKHTRERKAEEASLKAPPRSRLLSLQLDF
jgi:hypothetical protein